MAKFKAFKQQLEGRVYKATSGFFNSLPPKLIILENRKIPVSNKMCYLPT